MEKLVWMVLLEVKSIKYEECFQCQTDSTLNLHIKNRIEQGNLTVYHCVPYTLNTLSCEWLEDIILPQVQFTE